MRLDANRTIATITTSSSFSPHLLQQHSSLHPALAPVPSDDVTMTSQHRIPAAAYHQSRASHADADWSTPRLPVGHVIGADRRHLQQLELGNSDICDVQTSSPTKDSAIADGKPAMLSHTFVVFVLSFNPPLLTQQ